MSKDSEFLFLPLGGAEEIGMNLNLYGIDDKWLMVDLGVSFGEDRLPGVEVVMPDPSYIEARCKDLLGLVLTHGHEDHLGAVQYLWPRLQCPVYATPFTAALLRSKLSETDFADHISIHEVSLGARFTLGPFDLEFITVTHSIPEPNALAIRTRLGTVLHTGDFKIDSTPLVGDEVDVDALCRVGDEGVLAMVCDSTNVFESGESGSEGALRESLDEIVCDRSGRIALTTFASNLARIETAAWVAIKNDRHPVLVGRSLWRILGVARESGYDKELPDFLSEHDAAHLPPEKVLLICTGSQGEPRGAMARIAQGSHPRVQLESGDLAIFSSKIIPGNERSISRLHNQLVNLGVEIITEKDALVHVSGHPSRDDLARMYNWVRPRVAIPVHGERRHVAEHAALARSLQIPEAIEVSNGALVRLAPGPANIIDHVSNGRLAVDGNRVVDVESQFLRERRRLMFNGMVNVVLVLDSNQELASTPSVSSRGVFNGDEKSCSVLLANKVEAAFNLLPKASRNDEGELREVARLAVRREIFAEHKIRPDISVDLVQLKGI
ncbi:MAG TPA: ribonuclease J [Alphaproteobacteria bacterium]|nr:ribonuclease J [Alphaproteobacteria bacterium]